MLERALPMDVEMSFQPGVYIGAPALRIDYNQTSAESSVLLHHPLFAALIIHYSKITNVGFLQH